VYGKIRGALGVSKCVVSGGGSLQPHLDEFYEVLDLTVLNGWGLSEVMIQLPSSAVTSLKPVALWGTLISYWHPLPTVLCDMLPVLSFSCLGETGCVFSCVVSALRY